MQDNNPPNIFAFGKNIGRKMMFWLQTTGETSGLKPEGSPTSK